MNIPKKTILMFAATCLCSLTFSPAFAGPYEEAVAAYNTKNYTQAAAKLKPLATSGNAKALVMLGYMYQNALGTEQNYIEAARLFKKAAQLGNVTGQTNLGYMYEHGMGVTQSYTEAATWYTKATQRGAPDAALNLANLYENGLGVPKDVNIALNLYQKLVQADYAPAKPKLHALRSKMSQTSVPALQNQPKLKWLVGRWGQVKEDGKGGYKDGGGVFGHACSNHDNRGFATFSYTGSNLVADIIGSSAAEIMFESFDKSAAKHTVVNDKHVKIYPKKWEEDWLELKKIKPELLSAHLYLKDSKDEKFLLKQCK